MDLTERQALALQLRRSGKKMYEIGAALNVSPDRARKLVERAKAIEREHEWANGLPARVVRLLTARGIKSRSQLDAAVADGSLARMPGVGAKCYETITKWLQGK